MPLRVQIKRTKGWRMPENTVKVDRTTRWGNPFTPDQCGSAENAVACHRAWVLRDEAELAARACAAPPEKTPPAIEEIRRELRGKNLACWCAPGAPCHADWLLTLANDD